MDRRGLSKASRMRNWLAMLLMVVAAIAAGRTQAADETSRIDATVATMQGVSDA